MEVQRGETWVNLQCNSSTFQAIYPIFSKAIPVHCFTFQIFSGKYEPCEHEFQVKGLKYPYPSGEYSRLNTAPWVWVLRLIDSTAGFIEQYKLVIVLKLSLAGSTNTPRLIVLLCSHENRLFPLRLSVLETSLLPVGGSADGRLPGSRSPGAGDLALPSVRSPLLSGGEGEPTRAMSSSTSESSLPLLGLSWDSSASSLSLWCSELIVASPASTQPSVFRGAVSTAKGWLTPVTYRAWNRVFFQPFRMPWQWVLAA